MEKKILALVGMPGAGKSRAAAYLAGKGIPGVRFGELTDEGVKALNLPLNPKNERWVREQMRQELGMAAYAIKSKPRIDDLLASHDVISIDGLYSWEEYIFLKKQFPGLILIHVYLEPHVRYERLSRREIRPMAAKESLERDRAEIEKLDKGGPIAMADYLIHNNGNRENLFNKLDQLLVKLGITV